MENIIEPNETFDFSKLSLAHPSGIQGGAYFTRIEHNNKPLYIQTCKSQTRQGIIKTGKKYYCDLMFDKNAESLINWFENLEERCQKLIYEKRESWFQNSLEETDIETAFNSVIRVYKSGKYYLVRTNVKNSHTTNLPSIKIYNENEIPLKIEDINNETNIISILEIQGIKFTSRNFQIEIELKQIMVLDNEPIFENCLIKSRKNVNHQVETIVSSKNISDSSKTSVLGMFDDLIDTNNSEKILDQEDAKELSFVNLENNLENNLEETVPLDILTDTDNVNNDSNNLELEIEDLDKKVEDDNLDELKEVDINTSLEQSEPMHLKKPNQVYFELYKEARNKAKIAKKNAILAYLEAKNIKKTYMLENLNDSDSDFDNEIDDVSESELEGL